MAKIYMNKSVYINILKKINHQTKQRNKKKKLEYNKDFPKFHPIFTLIICTCAKMLHVKSVINSYPL